jgi:D-3-phosphoglycerate dehydrogenase
VNIAGMQIARQQRGGSALSILTVDSRVDDAVLAKVATEIDASVMKAIEVLEL